jgi:signal transduction histidine kinase
MSFRARILAAAAYLLLVVVVALEVPLALNVERRAVFEFQSGVLGPAAVAASQIADPVANASTATTGGNPEPPRDFPAIDVVIRRTAVRTKARVVVVDAFGRVLADSAREAALGTLYATPLRPEFGQALAGNTDIRQRFSQSLGVQLLVVTVPVREGTGIVGAVRLSASLGEVESKVHEAWVGLAAIGLGVICVGLLLAWFLATTLARPVRRLGEAADRLGRGDLAARAPSDGPSEVASLARSFNRMAETLGGNISSQQEFVANASHQLRTPLTGLRLRLEAIQNNGGPDAAEAGKALADVDRLAALVDDMLGIARATLTASSGTEVDLGQVASEAIERWMRPAADAGMTLRIEVRSNERVWADPDDLGHALDNLIENSVRYCPGAEIDVTVFDRDASPAFAVSDTGPGIAEHDREHVFERFFRGEEGRRAGGGTGLGLAIVSELVGRWGGVVRLVDPPAHRSHGPQGTRFEVTFPPIDVASRRTAGEALASPTLS